MFDSVGIILAFYAVAQGWVAQHTRLLAATEIFYTLAALAAAPDPIGYLQAFLSTAVCQNVMISHCKLGVGCFGRVFVKHVAVLRRRDPDISLVKLHCLRERIVTQCFLKVPVSFWAYSPELSEGLVSIRFEHLISFQSFFIWWLLFKSSIINMRLIIMSGRSLALWKRSHSILEGQVTLPTSFTTRKFIHAGLKVLDFLCAFLFLLQPRTTLPVKCFSSKVESVREQGSTLIGWRSIGRYEWWMARVGFGSSNRGRLELEYKRLTSRKLA